MKKKKGLSLVVKLILIAVVPVLLTGGIVTYVGINALTTGMRTEKLDDLATLADSIAAAYEALDDGEYYLENDSLMKGELNISAQTALLDSFMADNHNEVTFFFGNTRYATTILDASGARIVGTPCTDEVYQAVIVEGQVYEAGNVPINGAEYYAAYIPLKNGNEIVGMLFCGAPRAEVAEYINSQAATMIFALGAVFVISIVLVTISVYTLARGLKAAEKAVIGLSEGNLTV